MEADSQPISRLMRGMAVKRILFAIEVTLIIGASVAGVVMGLGNVVRWMTG